MSTTTQVKKVKINKMSKARYEQTTPVATELYMLTDVLDPQYDVLPTADAKYAGQITQYTGESVDGGLTNGYFYKCTAQGTSPETYAWEQTDVQPSGGSSYTAGSGIDITNNVISTTDPVLKNVATGEDAIKILGASSSQYGLVAIGPGITTSSTTGSDNVLIGRNAGNGGPANQAVAIGCNTRAGLRSIAIGRSAMATADYAIQLGCDGGTNSDAKTFKVYNGNGNYEIMSADGTIPEARLADTTNAAEGQVLKLDSNLNAVWASGGSGGAVDSVNGQTGTVVLDADDVGALPISGGETTGAITITTEAETSLRLTDALTLKTYYDGTSGTPWTIKQTPSGSVSFPSFTVTGSILKGAGTIASLGGSGANTFQNTYTKKLNNGADINVPTVGGTMALLDDTSTTSTDATWSASKLNTTIGNIESLLANI